MAGIGSIYFREKIHNMCLRSTELKVFDKILEDKVGIIRDQYHKL